MEKNGGRRTDEGREPEPGDEIVSAETAAKAFGDQIERLITLALWAVMSYALMGVLVGAVGGMLMGMAFYHGFDVVGLLDGVKTITRRVPLGSFFQLYYMLVSGIGFMAVGAGIGIRHAIVTGHTAVARLVLNSALEQAIRNARGSARPGNASRLQTLALYELEGPLRERVDALADYVEGYGLKRYFRRFVSTLALDYIEEVTFETAKRHAENPDDPALNKDAILATQTGALQWIKSRAARNTMLITAGLIVVPIIGMLVFFCFPALGSVLMHNLK